MQQLPQNDNDISILDVVPDHCFGYEPPLGWGWVPLPHSEELRLRLGFFAALPPVGRASFPEPLPLPRGEKDTWLFGFHCLLITKPLVTTVQIWGAFLFFGLATWSRIAATLF